MRRLLLIGTTALLVLVPATSALGTVDFDQSRDSVHHEVFSEHALNICGNLGTFTFDVTSHTHVLDNGKTFLFEIHETYTSTLVFDNPALGTWTAHAAENIHYVADPRRRGVHAQLQQQGRPGPDHPAPAVPDGRRGQRQGRPDVRANRGLLRRVAREGGGLQSLPSRQDAALQAAENVE
jgi:hypothetical protein